MRTIHRRLRQLETTFMPAVAVEDAWGHLAEFRDQLLRRAELEGPAEAAQLRIELEAAGPTGFLVETIRCHLREHGFVQEGKESLAETTARALDMSIPELNACIKSGRLGQALLDRFE